LIRVHVLYYLYTAVKNVLIPAEVNDTGVVLQTIKIPVDNGNPLLNDTSKLPGPGMIDVETGESVGGYVVLLYI